MRFDGIFPNLNAGRKCIILVAVTFLKKSVLPFEVGDRYNL